MRRQTRRDFLKLGAAVTGATLGVGVLTACQGILGPGAPAQPKKIVVTAYAGVWEEAFRANYVPVFKQKHPDIEVEVLSGDETAWIQKVKADPKNPPIHVLMAGLAYAFQIEEEGLTDKLTEDKVPNLKDITPSLREPFKDLGVATNYGLGGLMYNKNEVKEPPKSWEEFIDRTIKGDFGKRVTIPSINYSFCDLMVLYNFAYAMKVPLDEKLQPVFEKLKAMKPNIVKFYTSPAEVLNLFTSKEAVIAIYWDGRAWAFHDQGNDWVGYLNPKPAAVINPVVVHKVKNAPDVAFDFVNAMLDPKAQAGFGAKVLYAMSNSKVQFPPDIAPKISKAEEGVLPPGAEVGKLRPKWIENWNKEIGG